jgi:hypothetical protein
VEELWVEEMPGKAKGGFGHFALTNFWEILKGESVDKERGSSNPRSQALPRNIS